MAPRKVDRAARREEILAAAVRVFARRGYAASRIDDVAREAGIAKGSVYLYFGSREELLQAAFDGLSERSAGVLREAAEGEGAAGARLERLVRDVLGMLAAERDLARVLLDVWSAGRGEPAVIDMAGFYREYRAAIAGLLAGEAAGPDDVEAGAHAAVLVGAIEGCVLQWLFDPELDLGALTEPLVRLLVPGAGRAA